MHPVVVPPKAAAPPAKVAAPKASPLVVGPQAGDALEVDLPATVVGTLVADLMPAELAILHRLPMKRAKPNNPAGGPTYQFYYINGWGPQNKQQRRSFAYDTMASMARAIFRWVSAGGADPWDQRVKLS